MLRHYEIMTISTQTDDGVKKALGEVGAKIVKEDNWGNRKFAYEINRKTEGIYNVMEFDLESTKLNELKSKLNFQNDLIRYLIINEGVPAGNA